MRLLPLVVFLLAAAVSFATGTSWGTMAILMPLVYPLGAVLPVEAGLAAETRSFDPWGKTRNPDWTAAAIDPPLTETPRGFTDHEHIQTVGLIHMNGRVQDPVTGRFISPDPSDALNPGVGFNRYAYALNNPRRPFGLGAMEF